MGSSKGSLRLHHKFKILVFRHFVIFPLLPQQSINTDVKIRFPFCLKKKKKKTEGKKEKSLNDLLTGNLYTPKIVLRVHSRKKEEQEENESNSTDFF